MQHQMRTFLTKTLQIVYYLLHQHCAVCIIYHGKLINSATLLVSMAFYLFTWKQLSFNTINFLDCRLNYTKCVCVCVYLLSLPIYHCIYVPSRSLRSASELCSAIPKRHKITFTYFYLNCSLLLDPIILEKQLKTHLFHLHLNNSTHSLFYLWPSLWTPS